MANRDVTLADMGDAFERAAVRTSRGVRPRSLTRLGRQEGEPTRRLEQLGEMMVPRSPLDYAMLVLGGAPGRLLSPAAKVGALVLGGLLESDEARAGKAAILKLGRAAPKGAIYPDIYKRPDVIAREAEARVAPEHPALKELFGVTRADLAEIGQHGRRVGNIVDPQYGGTKANPRGSYILEGLATPGNEQRLISALGEAEKLAPRLVQGMDNWYVMDPMYQRMVQLVGPEQAKRDYARLNTLTGMASPGSEVLTEINRGTAANMMAARGEFPLFQQYGGVAEARRGADFPAILRDVKGHAYHSTAQAGPMGRYLEGGAVEMTSPKVPLYIQASGVPETGFQTRLPVADAHFVRAIGASDIRAAHGHTNPGVSMKTPEYAPTGPWFRERVATPLGIEAVPGQARLWGLMSQYTGVDTPVGAPKLELYARNIWDRAQKLGIDPKMLLDQVLTGRQHAGWLIPGAGVPLMLGGSPAADE